MFECNEPTHLTIAPFLIMLFIIILYLCFNKTNYINEEHKKIENLIELQLDNLQRDFQKYGFDSIPSDILNGYYDAIVNINKYKIKNIKYNPNNTPKVEIEWINN